MMNNNTLWIFSNSFEFYIFACDKAMFFVCFRLEALINERKPAMIANYNAECERVQNER